MLNLEIDGKPVQVAPGATVMEAAHKLGIYVPHFCYHKKLSIAANCRMCLVQVEKAPKPLPACATPVAEGMKAWTHSELAVAAQKAVMEFLLINHPLDCPICDQGGECQLQDLAVGYGGSGSRYDEPKRIVNNKDLGPLISTDMTRCIHCTRCVRFGQEIAGIMELGMIGRGEHSEIIAFVGKTVDSELSGNSIDLCPVGALTSKPFRYSARTWELTRRPSVSSHCGLGSNLTVQVKQNRVMRVLPRENDAVNECWLSDKDRFAYEGLNSADRLVKPMIKQNGAWAEVDWQVALEFVATGLRAVRDRSGADQIGALATPHQTVEELYLLQKLVRALGSENIDFRTRQSGFEADAVLQGAPWLGMAVAEIAQLDITALGQGLLNDRQIDRVQNDDSVFVHAQGAGSVNPVALPAGGAQFGEHLSGVVAALGCDDDLAALERFYVEGVLQRGFVFGHRRGFATRVRGGEEHWLDQVKVFFLNHAVHENRADHAAPANESDTIAYFVHEVALSVRVLTPGTSGRERRDGPELFSRWSLF